MSRQIMESYKRITTIQITESTINEGTINRRIRTYDESLRQHKIITHW